MTGRRRLLPLLLLLPRFSLLGADAPAPTDEAAAVCGGGDGPPPAAVSNTTAPPLARVLFWVASFASAERASYQHPVVALAEGLRELGVEVRNDVDFEMYSS